LARFLDAVDERARFYEDKAARRREEKAARRAVGAQA